MNYPSLPGQAYAPEKMLLPVAIDYPAALALRQMAIVQDELPKYLLAPLSDKQYVSQLEMMVATLKIPLERR
ncbi:phage integrase family protein, partial [Salmonella enterica subsp. enterica serovar Minnesota]